MCLVEQMYLVQHRVVVQRVQFPVDHRLEGLPEALEEQVLVARAGGVVYAYRLLEKRHDCTVRMENEEVPVVSFSLTCAKKT